MRALPSSRRATGVHPAHRLRRTRPADRQRRRSVRTRPCPSPTPALIPTVKVADAVGWAEGQTPTPAPGLAVAPSPPASTIRAGSTCCPTATCWWPRPTRRRKPDEGKGVSGWVMKHGDEEGRRRRAERQPHHAAARRRRRRRGRDAHGLPAGPELAVRHGAGRRRLLRRQHRRGGALPLRAGPDRGSRRRPTQAGRPARRPLQPPLDQER